LISFLSVVFFFYLPLDASIKTRNWEKEGKNMCLIVIRFGNFGIGVFRGYRSKIRLNC